MANKALKTEGVCPNCGDIGSPIVAVTISVPRGSGENKFWRGIWACANGHVWSTDKKVAP